MLTDIQKIWDVSKSKALKANLGNEPNSGARPQELRSVRRSFLCSNTKGWSEGANEGDSSGVAKIPSVMPSKVLSPVLLSVVEFGVRA